jgi:hypothetical protein
MRLVHTIIIYKCMHKCIRGVLTAIFGFLGGLLGGIRAKAVYGTLPKSQSGSSSSNSARLLINAVPRQFAILLPRPVCRVNVVICPSTIADEEIIRNEDGKMRGLDVFSDIGISP